MELRLPAECFKYGHGAQQINNEPAKGYEITKVNTEGIISLEVKDALYPWEVFASADAVFATNAVKSLLIESIKLLVKPQFILGTIYTLARKKELKAMVDNFNRQAKRILSPYILKYHHMTLVSQETHFCIFSILLELGLEEEQSDTFAEICAHILEYDNAYRFRVVDLMEKMTKEDFLNPRKAIQKLKNISREREGGEINIASKKDKILTLVQLATFVPKIRRAIIKVTQGMNLSNLQSQEHHHYWFCLPQYAYQFMGMTNEQRKEYREKKGWTYPEGMVNSH